jgi:RimJ/RimL family protein N-acetyltransferase
MPFDPQPILKGELLGLRPLRPEDFDDLYAVASDPLIWEQHPANDGYQKDVFQEFFREALGRRDSMDTMMRRARSKSAGRFWPGPIGAASTTGK